VDSRTLTLSTFTTNGEYINSFSLELRPYRIAVTNVGPVVHVFPAEKMFRQLNGTGTVINKFGTLIENQVLNAFSLDGDILRNPHGGFIYVAKHASLIYYFDDQGNIQQITRRPDGQNYPAVIDKSTEDRKMVMAPTTKREARSSAIHDDELYINTRFRKESDPDQFVIDKYALISGVYISSFKLPKEINVNDFQIMGDTLYIVSDSIIDTYLIKDVF
jgi:hypothetical protein